MMDNRMEMNYRVGESDESRSNLKQRNQYDDEELIEDEFTKIKVVVENHSMI